MATLELGTDGQAAVAPLGRTRRLGPLFWAAVGWTVFILSAAALAPLLSLPSPTDMDMLERRAPMSLQH